LNRLLVAKHRVVAFSRQKILRDIPGLTWYQIDRFPPNVIINTWVCLAPIWVLPDYFPFFRQSGVRRVIALSSTSLLTKTDSSDYREQSMARRIAEAEEQFVNWAQANSVDWCILRPTLIYGYGKDRNIAELARIIRRYRFFPLLGSASGLRQPVHADDVAQACIAALEYQERLGRSFNLSGGEILSYRNMIERIFLSLGLRPRFFSVPLPLFNLAICVMWLLPRYRHWSGAMAERMNRDLVFNHQDAATDLGFSPRGFVLRTEDLP
jgi:nucleoside-diphosphate-sugar epimerase